MKGFRVILALAVLGTDMAPASSKARMIEGIGSTEASNAAIDSCESHRDFSDVPEHKRAAVRKFYYTIIAPFWQKEERNRAELRSALAANSGNLDKPVLGMEAEMYSRQKVQKRADILANARAAFRERYIQHEQRVAAFLASLTPQERRGAESAFAVLTCAVPPPTAR